MDESQTTLAEVEVLNLSGQAVSVASLWTEQVLALFFIRHFG